MAFHDYLRRPRPRLAETSTSLRDVLLIVLVGPCFLFAAIKDLSDGGVWPAALIPVGSGVDASTYTGVSDL